MVDRSAFEVGGNLAVTPGRGRPPHRGVRADPVHAADRAGPRGAAAARAADDQQVLRARPGPGPQPGGVPRPARASRSSSCPGATRTRGTRRGTSTPTCRPILDALGRGGADQRRRTHRADRDLLGRHPRQHDRRLPRRHRPARPAGRVRPGRHRDRHRRAPAPRRPFDQPPLAAAAKAMSERRGYLDGRALAEVFAWLRPGRPGLELLGEQLPAGQEAAGVRHPVLERRHHPDDGSACMPTSSTWRWTTSSPARRRSPCWAHRSTCPAVRPTPTSWPASPTTSRPGRTATAARNCSAATTRFVLSTSGHIAALVNPPGNPKASFQVNKTNPADPADWLKSAETQQGTWWTDVSAWLAERCGGPEARPGTARRRRAACRSSTRPAPTSSTAERSTAMYETIGRSLGTDYFRIADQLTRGRARLPGPHPRVRRRRGAAGHQRLLGARRVPSAADREAGRPRASSATASSATAARR